MHVLVTVSSKHGSTREIGEEITATLNAAGLNAEFRDIESGPNPTQFDAIVLGSAIYMGNWMDSARTFLTNNQTTLAGKPVWLFSSGPIGDDAPKPDVQPDALIQIGDPIGARDHRIFAGKVDPAGLGLKEKVMLKVVKAPAGDFRPWDEITAWAESIAAALLEPA